MCCSIETPSALWLIPQQSHWSTQFILQFFHEVEWKKFVLVFVSTPQQWLCKLAPVAPIWYHDRMDDEGSDNFSVQIRQSNQTFVSPTRGSVQIIKSWLNVRCVERKESGRQKRSGCKKVSRCPCLPFVLSLLLSRLANISFFTAPPYAKLQNAHFHFPPPTCPLLSLYLSPFGILGTPMLIIFFLRFLFPSWFYLFSLWQYCRRVLDKFQQMYAVKVTLARIYWRISIVLFKRMPKPCLGGKGKDFKECKEFAKSSVFPFTYCD